MILLDFLIAVRPLVVLDTSACLIKGVNDRAGTADVEMARRTFESSRNEVSYGSLKLLSPLRLSAPGPWRSCLEASTPVEDQAS